MKKSLHLLVFGMALLMALSVTSQNLFPAGNLENGVSDWVIKWNSGTAGTFAVSSVAAEGTKSALIDVTKTNADLTKVVLTGPQFTGIDDRSSYRISTMMKANVAPNEIRIQFVTKDAAGTNRFNNSPKSATEEFYKLTTEYKNYKWIVSTNKKGYGAAAEFRFNCAKYVAQYYLDNIKVERIEGIEDGGFEDGDLSYGYTPSVNTLSGVNATIAIDKASPYKDTNALKAQVTAKSDTVSHVNIASNVRYYPEFGKKYEFTFYAKGTNANDSVFANINFYNGNNDFISSKNQGFKLTSDYSKYKVEFSLPADSLFSTKFRLDFGKQVSTIWVDELEVHQSTTTGNIEIADNKFTCYPNPTSGYLIVKGIEPGSIVELMNIAGVTIGKQNAGTDEMRIEMHEMPNGIYFVKSGNKVRRVLKSN